MSPFAGVDDEEGAGDRRPLTWAGVVFLLIIVAMIVDLVDDVTGTASGPIHVVFELATLGLAVAGGLLTTARLRTAFTNADELRRDMRRVQAELDTWRAEAKPALGGLREAIDKQFGRWGLTSAERDIALLILKGLSHKEIAEQRTTTERTVRQQSLAIYRKANLAGRAELSAFFLNDLLVPEGEAVKAQTPPAT